MAIATPISQDEPTPIDSLASFVVQLYDLRRLEDDLKPIVWFRGHADASWDLLPGALRNRFLDRVRLFIVNPESDVVSADIRNDAESAAFEETEKLIIEEFRRKGAPLFASVAD